MEKEKIVKGIGPLKINSTRTGSFKVVVPRKVLEFLGVGEGGEIYYIIDNKNKKVYIIKNGGNIISEMEKIKEELKVEAKDISLEFAVSEELSKKILKKK